MNEFKVMNDRTRKPFSKALTVLFGLLLLLAGVFLGVYLGIVIGLLLIWAAFFVKYTSVNEKGIVVNYDAKIFRYQEEWNFDEITNIHREHTKDPLYVILHFTKGAMSKRLVFMEQDAQSIIDFARMKNQGIHFDEAE